jgi:RNA polymerase sigma factor (sigma-70 family)
MPEHLEQDCPGSTAKAQGLRGPAPEESVFGFDLDGVYPVTPMNDDAALLQNYANEGSDSAFTELVRRHVALVYGAALRRTGDAHAASDVAQQVFIALARNARQLSGHTLLSAWLHTATRNASLNLMISEARRKARESAAAAEADVLPSGPEAGWEQIRPILDAAIDELPQADRDAVVLRFLERRPFAEIGGVLRVSEDAARMRTERALDKLRALLNRRGITSTAAAVGAALLSPPLTAAPTGIASALAAGALAAVAPGTAAVPLISLMTTKTIAVAALGAFLAFGAGTYYGISRSFSAAPSPPLAIPEQSRTIASLRHDNQSLKADVDRLTGDTTRLSAAYAGLAARAAAPKPAPARLTIGQKQQSVLNNLRQIDAARAQFKLDKGQAANSVQDLVGDDKYIRRLNSQDGEDYTNLSMVPGQALSVSSPNGLNVTFDPSGANTTKPEWTPGEQHAQDLEQKVGPSANQAVAAYRAANGRYPPSAEALIAYFPTPQEGADFVEYLEAQKATLGK